MLRHLENFKSEFKQLVFLATLFEKRRRKMDRKRQISRYGYSRRYIIFKLNWNGGRAVGSEEIERKDSLMRNIFH